MEKELSLFIKKADLKGTTIVFRQGSRLMIGDLDKVSVATARSVVVFSDTGMVPDQADAEILQVILNLNNMQLAGTRRRGGEGQGQRGVDPPHRTR
jgi:hypothetical protein